MKDWHAIRIDVAKRQHERLARRKPVMERAVLAEERAEQAPLPDIADGWHKLAHIYRALAHQHADTHIEPRIAFLRGLTPLQYVNSSRTGPPAEEREASILSASVVIVHDDPSFLEAAADAIRNVGHSVAVFGDPTTALNALEGAGHVDVLITRGRYPKGQPNGVSLALLLRTKQPGLKVVFTALAEYEQHFEGIGVFLPLPVDMPELVETVARLIDEH